MVLETRQYTLEETIRQHLDPLVFAQEMEIEPDDWQLAVIRPTKRQTIILCTRQAGKSYATGIRALHHAIFNAGSQIIIAAPGERQAKLLLEVIKILYSRYPGRRRARKWNVMSVEFHNGSTIEALPGKDDTIRGYSSIDLLILDEASRVTDTLYHAVRPMLAVSGGDLILLSTPFGKRGFYYETWERAVNDPSWLRIGPIPATQITRISAQFLQEERDSLPRAIYEQEYECKFTDRIGTIFMDHQIRWAMSDQELQPLFPDYPLDALFETTETPLFAES